MPWRETDPMKEKVKMIADYLDGYSVTDLSRRYSVSRNTVYRITGRYDRDGIDGLHERSRRPGHHPRTTSDSVVEAIITVKKKYRSWGPKKITQYLAQERPEVSWPAPSTAGSWLLKYDLVKPRKKRRRVPPYTQPFVECVRPNDVWSADYKGQFTTGDGVYCYPLTISDNASRYLLGCKGLFGPRYEESRREFERVFREYGLPYAMRTDNGVPFAGPSLTGLTRMSIWWIRLGIYPERIEPGKPQQNGRHERMHRTLKDETAQPARKDMKHQQLCFERFKEVYNKERPHESLGMQRPVDVYSKSRRRFPPKLPEIEYDYADTVRRVRTNGEVKFHGQLLYLSELLAGEPVCFREKDDDIYTLYYSFYPIAQCNMRDTKNYPITRKPQ